jgi:hypothetical protein
VTVYLPVLPDCIANGGGWCRAKGTVWLCGPEGDRVPGATYCVEHGAKLVAEYRRKLDEAWTLEPIEKGQPREGEE